MLLVESRLIDRVNVAELCARVLHVKVGFVQSGDVSKLRGSKYSFFSINFHLTELFRSNLGFQTCLSRSIFFSIV